MARINIQIEGMSIAEAKVVMRALTQSVADVSPETAAQVEASAEQIEELVDKGRQAAAAEAAETPVEGGEPPKTPKPAKPKAKAKPKAPPEKKAPKQSVLDDDEFEPDDGGKVVDLDEKRGGGLVDKLATMTKLKDVLGVLRDAGFKDDDTLIAECEKLQDQVPVLKKIPNLQDRVRRVLERFSA